ncbi:MAG: cyclopropane-fatty-acyl-phospholipid synthase [Chloroflexota bacterium]|nr:cyclopropane-fatty-acyl-phospholipid synthase [Chloroflexota bacterium]MDE2885247.1 cyclopropane-fatty-acyl-phospholipid synthase [Chloroflexota bacterium]
MLARRAFFAAVGSIKLGSLRVDTPNHRSYSFETTTPGPQGVLRIHDESFYRRVITGGEIGFGEAYQDGLCDSPDLVQLLMLAVLNRQAVNLNRGPMRLLSKRANLRLHRSRANTRDQSKDNIHAHYDLGNSFFELFLDETLTYSSAVFAFDGQLLRDAQANKYQRMCEFAGITAGSRVLEIGSGWGGFAIHAAREFGCHVTTVTISQEQFDLATQRIREAGLSDRIDVRLMDYRDVAGSFDSIVSIEMFEAVGAEFFETFFLKCASLLKPGGRLAMQVITVPDRNFAAQKSGVNWIQKYIFPGGVLPSLSAMEQANARTGLVVASLDHIGQHYAVTLRQWRRTFWDRIEDVRALGYDERFVRTWDYYLAACEAGFLTNNTDDLQIVFEKPASHA